MQPDQPTIRARWSVAFVFLLNGAVLGGLFPYLPEVKHALHLSDHQLGLSLLFSPMGAVLAMPVAGKVLARIGTRSVTALTAFILCCSVPLALIAPNVWLLRLCLFTYGASNGSMDVSINTEAVLVQHRYSKPIMSFTHGCWSLGGFVASASVALAAKLGQPRFAHACIMDAVILALVLIACRFFLEKEKNEEVEEHAFAIPRGGLLFLGVLTACAFATEGACYDWVSVYFRNSLLTAQSVAAMGFAVFVGAMALARLTGDEVVHRLGNKRALQVGAVIATGGTLLAVCSGSIALAYCGYALAGIGVSNLVPILFRTAGSVKGVPPGVGIAAVSTCGYFAFLLSPAVIGFVADRVSLAFALGAAGMLALVVGANAKRAVAMAG